MKILMVCLGNICRSPMAEGILRDMAMRAAMDWEIDSAGTGSWHIGEPPDARAVATCAKRGLDIQELRARQIQPRDLEYYDWILTMDDANYAQVLSMAHTHTHRSKIKPIMSFDTTQGGRVPDPYYDGKFDEVYHLLNHICGHIIAQMR